MRDGQTDINRERENQRETDKDRARQGGRQRWTERETERKGGQSLRPDVLTGRRTRSETKSSSACAASLQSRTTLGQTVYYTDWTLRGCGSTSSGVSS